MVYELRFVLLAARLLAAGCLLAAALPGPDRPQSEIHDPFAGFHDLALACDAGRPSFSLTLADPVLATRILIKEQ